MKAFYKVILVNSKEYVNFDESILEVDLKDLFDCENYSLEKTVFDQMKEKILGMCTNFDSGVSVIVRNCEVLFSDWNTFITSSSGLNKYKHEDTRVLSYGIDFLEKIGNYENLNLLLDSRVECKDTRITNLYKHVYLS